MSDAKLEADSIPEDLTFKKIQVTANNRQEIIKWIEENLGIVLVYINETGQVELCLPTGSNAYMTFTEGDYIAYNTLTKEVFQIVPARPYG